MELLFRPVTKDNVGDLVANSEDTPFYPLPANNLRAEDYLVDIDTARDMGIGDDFAAYDAGRSERLVGGGQVSYVNERCTIGYWVVRALRRQGYGRAIAHGMEAQAISHFPGIDSIELDIDTANEASFRLAASIGYRPTGIVNAKGLVVYRKNLI